MKTVPYHEIHDSFGDYIRPPSEELQRQAAIKVTTLAIRQKWEADELALVLTMLGLKEDDRHLTRVKNNDRFVWSGDPRLR